MGNGWSNFTHIFSDFGKGIWDGITGDSAQARRDFENYVNDGHNLDYGNAFGTGRQYSAQQQAQMLSQQQAEARARSSNPNSAWNTGNWQSVSASVRSAHYGSQSGNAGVTPPSQLMKISNPAMKTAVAQSRGTVRSNINMAGNMADISLSSAFRPSGAPSNDPSASGTGGTMPQTSLDDKPQA